MKRALIGLVALGGLVGGLATNAAADVRFDRYSGYEGFGGQGRYDRIDQRQHFQGEQIRRGLASGQLTRTEYRELVREQSRIARLEAAAEADGRLTWRERSQIDHAQDLAARNIQHSVRDDDYRGRYSR
jgi:hypothetical protein